MSVICVFVLTLLSGIFLPVYSDEVMAKWSLGRFFLENELFLSFYPQCGATLERSVSLIFYPAASVLALIYSSLEPFGVRVSGILCTLIWWAAVAYWVRRQSFNTGVATRRLSLLVATSSLGVAPYMWVLSRTEQILTLTILIICMFAVVPREAHTPQRKVMYLVTLVLVVSCFFYSHPKSIFFLPFVCVATWIATATYNKFSRLSVLGFTLFSGYQVFKDASALSACTEAPFVQKMLTANTLLPAQLLSSPESFISAAFNNLWMFPDRFLRHVTFNEVFQSGWLPPLQPQFFSIHEIINNGVYYLSGLIVLGAHVLAIALFIVQVCRRIFAPAVVMAALLALADIVNVLFFNIQNFYAGTQFFPISVLLLLLITPSLPAMTPLKIVRTLAEQLLLGFAGLSMVLLLVFMAPALLAHAWSDKASVSEQPLSIPVLGTEIHLASIRRLGQQCDLPESGAKNLVVDHMTYFAYSKNEAPIHVLYISDLGYGQDLLGGKLLPLLRKLDSPGIIARCDWIPEEFKAFQKTNEMGYCCVNLKSIP